MARLLSLGSEVAHAPRRVSSTRHGPPPVALEVPSWRTATVEGDLTRRFLPSPFRNGVKQMAGISRNGWPSLPETGGRKTQRLDGELVRTYPWAVLLPRGDWPQAPTVCPVSCGRDEDAAGSWAHVGVWSERGVLCRDATVPRLDRRAVDRVTFREGGRDSIATR